MSRDAVTDATLAPAIAARWSPRSYAATPVNGTALHAVLEAGRWAASCYNDQPWSFVVGRNGTPEFVAMLATLLPFNQAWAKNAAVLIYSVARTHFAHDGKPNRHAWHDVGAATAQMAVEAAAQGMQMHGMAGFDGAAATAALGIPEGHEVVTAWTLGFPGEASALPEQLAARETAPRARREAATVFYCGKFGVAL